MRLALLLSLIIFGGVQFVEAQIPQAVKSPTVYHRIEFEGPVHSKKYVWIKLPAGKHIKVPVINGYLPTIYRKVYSNEELYTFSYHRRTSRFIYSGDIPHYVYNFDVGKDNPEVKQAPKIGIGESVEKTEAPGLSKAGKQEDPLFNAMPFNPYKLPAPVEKAPAPILTRPKTLPGVVEPYRVIDIDDAVPYDGLKLRKPSELNDR